MEIFTNEFKELLSTQLEELTNVVKKDEVKIDGAVVMSDYEIAKLMDACMNNSDCSKKEKKQKNKKFKVGDVVYLGSLQGEVVKFDEEDESIEVSFGDFFSEIFMVEGSIFTNTPIVLSYFPYKLKMKKIK